MVFLVLLNVVGGLFLESYGARAGWLWAEPLVSAVTLSHFAYYFLNPPKIPGFQVSRRTLGACLLLATVGELILSAMWGVYSYRQSVLPAFVPPGHVLLFCSGLAISSHRSCKSWVAVLVPITALVAISYSLVNNSDFLSVPLFAIFLACLVWGPNPKLYSVMFVLALGLELLGTSVATWTWTQIIPGTDFHSANPPIAAGVFYALLDLLTVRIASLRPALVPG
jgi:hypothetical protein